MKRLVVLSLAVLAFTLVFSSEASAQGWIRAGGTSVTYLRANGMGNNANMSVHAGTTITLHNQFAGQGCTLMWRFVNVNTGAITTIMNPPGDTTVNLPMNLPVGGYNVLVQKGSGNFEPCGYFKVNPA